MMQDWHRTNDTFVHSVEQGALNAMGVEAPEGGLEWSTLAPQSVVDGAFTYELDLTPSFSDANHPNSAVNNTTQSVIAGASNAYAQAEAIGDYLHNGSGSIIFQRNHNGSGYRMARTSHDGCSHNPVRAHAQIRHHVRHARRASPAFPHGRCRGTSAEIGQGRGTPYPHVHASTWAESPLRTDARRMGIAHWVGFPSVRMPRCR